MLEWTGERFIPGKGGSQVYYEHAHRYLLASRFAKTKTVLDLASGEGYGSSWLASNGGFVVGVDIDHGATRHASRRYATVPGLCFAGADIGRLPIATGSIDLVVCFEAVEHIDDHERLLDEIDRVLGPQGNLIVSTPDKAVYSDEPGYNNEFHVRELYLEEFEALLRKYFPEVLMFGQRVIAGSLIAPLAAEGDEPIARILPRQLEGTELPVLNTRSIRPIYSLAVCGRQPFSDTRSLEHATFFVDTDDELVRAAASYDPAIPTGVSTTKLGQGHECASRLQSPNEDQMTQAITEADAAREGAERELSALRATRLFRYTIGARALYGRLRRFGQRTLPRPHSGATDRVYATPWPVTSLDDCLFYHCIDLPESGEVLGEWDLRPGVDAYLGHVNLAGKRLLEIGPASGYLTFHMERSGADVVAIEVSEAFGWDYVPQAGIQMNSVLEPRNVVMRKLRNGFWLAHREFRSNAKVHYGSAYEIPPELGAFDVAVMGSVLLHNRAPLQIIENCARIARTLIITDPWFPELSEVPVCRLVPTKDNESWDTWWNLSPMLIVQFLEVLGFSQFELSYHTQLHDRERPLPFFTVVASHGDPRSVSETDSAGGAIPSSAITSTSSRGSDTTDRS